MVRESQYLRQYCSCFKTSISSKRYVKQHFFNFMLYLIWWSFRKYLFPTSFYLSFYPYSKDIDHNSFGSNIACSTFFDNTQESKSSKAHIYWKPKSVDNICYAFGLYWNQSIIHCHWLYQSGKYGRTHRCWESVPKDLRRDCC